MQEGKGTDLDPRTTLHVRADQARKLAHSDLELLSSVFHHVAKYMYTHDASQATGEKPHRFSHLISKCAISKGQAKTADKGRWS